MGEEVEEAEVAKEEEEVFIMLGLPMRHSHRHRKIIRET
jgi:hypothetical protein